MFEERQVKRRKEEDRFENFGLLFAPSAVTISSTISTFPSTTTMLTITTTTSTLTTPTATKSTPTSTIKANLTSEIIQRGDLNEGKNEKNQKSENNFYPLGLNAEQQKAFELIKQGKSVFITGSAGTGKSHLLKAIVEYLETIYTPENLWITASTGIASLHLGEHATTFQSRWKLQLGNEPVAVLKQKLYKKYVKQEWEPLKCVLIDEVSMLEPSVLMKFNELRQFFCQNSLPFGGTQMVLSGDFHQLEPVQKLQIGRMVSGEPEPIQKTPFNSGKRKEDFFQPQFLFQYPFFRQVFQRVQLTYPFRQKEDPEFFDFLQTIRLGTCSKKVQNILVQKCTPTMSLDELRKITPVPITCLFSTKRQVEQMNYTEMCKLNPPKHWKTFQAQFWQNTNVSLDEKFSIENWKKRWLEGSVAQNLQLTIGCPVLYLVNNRELNLVNGSQGYIESWYSPLSESYLISDVSKPTTTTTTSTTTTTTTSTTTTTATTSTTTTATTTAAITTTTTTTTPMKTRNESKTKLATLLETPKSKFCPTTAMTKTTINAISLKTNLKSNVKVTRNLPFHLPVFEKNKSSETKTSVYPVVRFVDSKGKFICQQIIREYEFHLLNKQEEKIATIHQIPLAVAFAFTVHKSQGLTLNPYIDFGHFFASGQGYVALSRAVSFSRLWVKNFDAHGIVLNPKIIEYENELNAIRIPINEEKKKNNF